MLTPRATRPLALFSALALGASALSALPCAAQTFVAVSSPAIASHVGFSTGAAWVDYDGDGDLDLYVVTAFGANNDNVLYRNDGGSVFTRITAFPLTSDGAFTVCSTWADFDNDGDLDCFVSGLDSAGGALGMSGGNRLFHNDGDGTFTEITIAPFAADPASFHHPTWTDFDGDGDLDVCFVRDNNQTNRYYRNNNDGTFTSGTTGAFVTTNRSEYGVANGDFDEDGDLDLFLPNARSEAASTLYRNDLTGANHWLKVHCTGAASNRSGIGAKVRVKATVGGAPRWQMRELTASSSYGGNNALDAHFGLGDASTLDSLRVEWPGGHVDVLTNVAADQLIEIEESPAVAVQDAANPAIRPSSLALVITPNPVRLGLDPGAVDVRFEMPATGVARLTVHDIRGRVVSELETQRLAAGWHALALGLPPVAAGVYFVRLSAPGSPGSPGAAEVERLTIVR